MEMVSATLATTAPSMRTQIRRISMEMGLGMSATSAHSSARPLCSIRTPACSIQTLTIRTAIVCRPTVAYKNRRTPVTDSITVHSLRIPIRLTKTGTGLATSAMAVSRCLTCLSQSLTAMGMASRMCVITAGRSRTRIRRTSTGTSSAMPAMTMQTATGSSMSRRTTAPSAILTLIRPMPTETESGTPAMRIETGMVCFRTETALGLQVISRVERVRP